MSKVIRIDDGYNEWFADIASRVRQNQLKAATCVNTEMLKLYWSIGADIEKRKTEHQWNSGVAWQLSRDLHEEFNFSIGFTEKNLKYMHRFFLLYALDSADERNVGFPQILGSVPWDYHIEIIVHCKSSEEAMFYIRKTIEGGWSRTKLLRSLGKDLYFVQTKNVCERVN
jgi:predicted nuclease of restriction endonuclease-like (RecB) superfamily